MVFVSCLFTELPDPSFSLSLVFFIQITVQRLLVYPIKSCGGIEVISANVDTMGLAGVSFGSLTVGRQRLLVIKILTHIVTFFSTQDRRFLMVDPKTKNMLTIRQYPRMVSDHLLTLSLFPDSLAGYGSIFYL